MTLTIAKAGRDRDGKPMHKAWQEQPAVGIVRRKIIDSAESRAILEELHSLLSERTVNYAGKLKKKLEANTIRRDMDAGKKMILQIARENNRLSSEVFLPNSILPENKVPNVEEMLRLLGKADGAEIVSGAATELVLLAIDMVKRGENEKWINYGFYEISFLTEKIWHLANMKKIAEEKDFPWLLSYYDGLENSGMFAAKKLHKELENLVSKRGFVEMEIMD